MDKQFSRDLPQPSVSFEELFAESRIRLNDDLDASEELRGGPAATFQAFFLSVDVTAFGVRGGIFSLLPPILSVTPAIHPPTNEPLFIVAWPDSVDAATLPFGEAGQQPLPDLPDQEMAEVDYVAHVVVMPIVLSIGMINQCLNVCTLWQLPSGGFLYLKASAIADILSILSFIPFLLRHANFHYQHCYTSMWYHAHLELPIINALIAASALCIVAMTVDRYLSVCHPIAFYNANESKRKTLGLIAALYATAFIVFTPSVFQKEVVEIERNGTDIIIYAIRRNDLVEQSSSFQAYLIFRELVARWGPVCILVVLNFLMMSGLRKMDKRSQRRSVRYKKGRCFRDDRSRISNLLLITSTTFVICNLPASFLSIFIRRSLPHSVFWQTFRAVSNLLQTTSYLYNFYLYALCSSEYRSAFLGLLGLQRRASRQSTGDSPTAKQSTRAAPRDGHGRETTPLQLHTNRVAEVAEL